MPKIIDDNAITLDEISLGDHPLIDGLSLQLSPADFTILPDGLTADETGVTADDTTNTADQF